MKERDGMHLRQFEPYPAYGHAGIRWIGDIPKHWRIRRLKAIASIIPSNVDKHTVDGERPVRLCNY